MTLAEELLGILPVATVHRRGRIVELEDPPLRLPFDGSLSPEELRMAAEFAIDGPASWE